MNDGVFFDFFRCLRIYKNRAILSISLFVLHNHHEIQIIFVINGYVALCSHFCPSLKLNGHILAPATATTVVSCRGFFVGCGEYESPQPGFAGFYPCGPLGQALILYQFACILAFIIRSNSTELNTTPLISDKWDRGHL
nr:MAG TPA: hypothetical protein [Caudoviricetes sp.]